MPSAREGRGRKIHRKLSHGERRDESSRRRLARAAPLDGSMALTIAPERLRCLVVDDEPRLRQVLVRLMEGDGFECSQAENGSAALQALQRETVPLVLTDLRMPQM